MFGNTEPPHRAWHDHGTGQQRHCRDETGDRPARSIVDGPGDSNPDQSSDQAARLVHAHASTDAVAGSLGDDRLLDRHHRRPRQSAEDPQRGDDEGVRCPGETHGEDRTAQGGEDQHPAAAVAHDVSVQVRRRRTHDDGAGEEDEPDLDDLQAELALQMQQEQQGDRSLRGHGEDHGQQHRPQTTPDHA